MFRFIVLAACFALAKGHAVVPVVAAHTEHGAAIVPHNHGYAGFAAGSGNIGGDAGGYGHGLVASHGFAAGHGLGQGYGAGLGVGNGFGAGHGVGNGIGAGHGVGNGFGAGHGVGNGIGAGLGVGNGFGAGHGVGNGFGAGHGVGNGFGAGHEVGSGFSGGHGFVAGQAGHGLGHHILKRSPHFAAPFTHAVPVVAAPVHVEPVAISHQHRVDLRASHAVLPVVPVVKPLVAPYLHGAPLFQKHFGAHYGAGAY